MQQPKKPQTTLPEDKRNQLDANIRKMIDNGAGEDDVRAYASDFKSQFAVKKKENTTSEVTAPEQSLESSGAQETTSSVTQEVDKPTEPSESPVANILPNWKPGDIKRNASAETMASFENWKSQSNLTEQEQEEVEATYNAQQSGDFGLVDNITNWFRSKNSSINPFYNPEAVTKPKTKDELIKEKIAKKRKDFLNNLDDPKKREQIQTLVKVENWQEDEKRVVVDRKITESVNMLEQLDKQVTPLLSQKQELESIELPENAPEDQVKALQQEYNTVTSTLTNLQSEGKKVYEEYEQSMNAYAEHTENIGRFEDELGMLKRDYQFMSNAEAILGLGTAEIASDLLYQGNRLGNTIANTILGQPELLEKQKQEFQDEALTRKGVLNKQREFLTPTVDANSIESVSDFIDFATNGILETTPTLIQLGLPYVGQASFVASQQANSELGLRESIKSDQKELLEVNDILSNPDKYNLTDDEVIGFAKRKQQLEQQDTPSEAGILMASSAMAASELLLGRLGKIRLINKAKRTAKAIGQNTLTAGVKKSYKEKFVSGALGIGDFAKDVGGEGLEELGVGIVGNIADMYVMDRKYNEDGTRKNILDGSFGNTLGGLSTGAALSGTTKTLGYAAREISDFKRRKAVVGNVKQINEYMERLNDPNISPELKIKIEGEIQKLNQKNGAIIKNVVEVFNGLSKEENAQLIKINNEISANEIALEQLVDDKGGDSQLVASLKAQINALDDAKSQLLDTNSKNENSLLSLLPEKQQLQLMNDAENTIQEQYAKDGVEEYTITDEEIKAKAEELINATSRNKNGAKIGSAADVTNTKTVGDSIVEDEVSEPNDVEEIENTPITKLKFIARGGIGRVGFFAFDKNTARNYQDDSDYSEGIINDDANILYLVDGNHSEPELNNKGIEKLVSILGKEEVDKMASEGIFEDDPSEITSSLWDESNRLEKLKNAGIDIVVGNTIDGVYPVVINENSISFKDQISSDTTVSKSNDVGKLYDNYELPELFNEVLENNNPQDIKEAMDKVGVEYSESDGKINSQLNREQIANVISELDYIPKKAKNETQTEGDTTSNGGVRSEPGEDIQQGQDTDVQPTTDDTASEGAVEVNDNTITRRVNPKGVKGEFDVTFDEGGSPLKVISAKSGQEVSKFVERKVKITKENPKGVKLVKNANYSRIIADATGGITENKAREERAKKIKDTLDSFVPTDAYGAALKAIASGDRVSLESARKETGLSSEEVKYATSFKSEESLPSIERLAEKIAESSEQELDVQEVRDALIDIIGGNRSTMDIEDALVEANDIESVEQQERELYQYKSSLTPKELDLLESVKAEDDYISELTDSEVQEYYTTKIDEYEKAREQITEQESRENDTRRETSAKNNEGAKAKDGTQEKGVDKLIKGIDGLINDIDESTKGTLGVAIAPAVAKAALQVLKASLNAGKTLAKAIQDAIDYIKSTSEYKKLSKADKKEALRSFEQSVVQGTNSPAQNKKYVEDVFESNDKEINKKKPITKRFRESVRKIIEKYSDRQFVAKVLLERSGMQSVKDLMINGHGSSGRAKRIYDEAYEKIYADQVKLKNDKVELRLISQADRKLLDKIIMLKRFIAIDKHRKKNGLPPVTHPGFINGKVAQDALDEYRNEVGDKKFSDLERRSKAYFDVYGKVLKDMYDNGLISKESYDSLNGVDYQPRQFLQHITDFEGNVSLGGAIKGVKDTGGLAKDQINSLKEGSEGALIRDSEWLLSTTIAGRYKAMAMNNVNKKFIKEAFPKAKKKHKKLLENPKKDWTKEDKRFDTYFKELSKKIKDNPVININENGTPERVYDKTPDNFKKAYYYENGVRGEFFIEEKLHDSWFDNIDGFLSPDAKSVIQTASGSSLLKAIATGNNPTFPIVNTPRDFAFLTIFSTQYSTFLPKAMLQVGKDSFKAVKEIFVSNKKNVSPENLFNKYVEYGGDMTFLSKQGRIKEGTAINKTLNKIFGPRFKNVGGKIFSALTLQKISTYSEMMFRIALMDRAMKNELKSRGFSKISDVKDKSIVDEIYNRAVADARGILDFNQGGAITKDAESLIPYLNTAVQGTRVMADAIANEPEKVIFKMAQAGAMMSGFTIGASLMLIAALRDSDDEEDKDLTAAEIYLKAQQGISKYQKIQYMNIVTGVKNEDGEYQVLKIAKTQPMAPVLSLTDNVTNHLASKMAGVDPKNSGVSYSEIGMAVNNNLAPIDISFLGALFTDESLIEGLASSGAGTITRTPLTKSVLTYATGYDFYREQSLTYDTDKDDPAMDGANDKNIESFYKDFGRDNRVSPARLKGAVEAFITTPSTNPFVGMLYGGADYISVSDGDIKNTVDDFWKTMKRSTTKRVMGYTSEFNREVNTMAPFKSEILEKSRENKYDIIDMKNDVRKAWDDEIDVKELISRISKYDIEVRKKMGNEIKSLAKKQDVPRYVMSLKFETDKEVRAMRILRYYGDIDSPDFKSTDEFAKMVEMNILDKQTMVYYMELLEKTKK